MLHPILGIPLASIGKLPFFGKLHIEAKGISDMGMLKDLLVVEATLVHTWDV